MKKLVLTCFLTFFSMLAWADIVAGIEIGSKGIKAIAIDYGGLDSQGQQEYKIIFREDIRADVIDGASDGYLQEKKIVDAANAVDALFKKMKKFDPQFFRIVGSTSFDNYKNKTALENAIYEKVKVKEKVQFITSDEEIFYALKASVRSKFSSKSILIDIGSGNTKVGYASPMSANGFESTRFEYGTKSLTQKAIAVGGDYQDSLKQIVRTEVIPVIREAIQKQPGIANVNRRIYIEGGASWAVASYAQPENITKNFTYLSLKEIDAVVNRFQGNDLKVNVSNSEIEDTFVKIGDNFDIKQLQAGALILQSIMKEVNASQRKIIFNRNGGWIIGYLIASYNEQRGQFD